MPEFTPDPYTDSAPAFSPSQRTTLEADEATRPYAAISKAQLLGLLVAFGETFAHGGMGEALGAIGESAPVRQLHGFLQRCYRQWCWPGPPRDAGAFFFTPHERQCIARHKYLKGLDAIDTDGLLALIKATAQYSLLAAPVPLYGPGTDPYGTLNRGPHAHNAFIAFRSRPFLDADFSRSIHVVVDGYAMSLEFPILDHVEWVRR